MMAFGALGGRPGGPRTALGRAGGPAEPPHLPNGFVRTVRSFQRLEERVEMFGLAANGPGREFK
jgi:hypothetical protein